MLHHLVETQKHIKLVPGKSFTFSRNKHVNALYRRQDVKYEKQNKKLSKTNEDHVGYQLARSKGSQQTLFE